ncbi:Telomerase-binding protein EST1A [Pseudolycoriella hygida]|uniref:Telomerase-binding protein EST1A n=1 Tax=Pseudolycoriella hygida TaxID=35572 RepID=A0A9Q0MYQ1_9DIPT|nr:Telomerase-binding protein EST1A [Pseudolycoriella hygida]
MKKLGAALPGSIRPMSDKLPLSQSSSATETQCGTILSFNFFALWPNLCAMSSNRPGLITIKQPVARKSLPERESVHEDYKPHTHKIIERLKEADATLQYEIMSGQCLENLCAMSSNRPGLITIKQPVARKSLPERESVQSLTRFFLKNIHFYSYSRAKWYDNISEDYKPHTHKIIERLKEADATLQYEIMSGQCLENWDKFLECRKAIKTISENCIRKEMKLCRKENVEQHIWKMLYYSLIELFKALIAESKSEQQKEYFQIKLKDIIEDGLKFYNNLLDVIQNTYHFKLSNLLENDVQSRALIRDNKFVQLALVSVQKYFLFLGDLSRYKETNRSNNNLASAKEYYLKAQRLIPTNGVPYNQLAFVALHSDNCFGDPFHPIPIKLQKNKFAAVYYYIRSLMASNPIQTAKENLKVLFDEARKNYETNRKMALEHKSPLKTLKQNSDGSRQEIWIHPVSGKSINRNTMQLIEDEEIDTDVEFDDFNAKEIAKRFMTSYVHIHGKLITKIGMDSFLTCAKQMLKEFQRLLNSRPIPLSFRCFIQIMCINVYTISEAPKNQASESRSDILDASLAISFCMFELMCRKFVDISNFTSLQPYLDLQLTIPEDAEIWTDWMISNVELWNPLQNLVHDVPLYSFNELLNSLGAIVVLLREFRFRNSNEDEAMITLPEDVMLEGFPLINSATKPISCQKTEKRKSMLLTRLQVILDNGNEILKVYHPTRQRSEEATSQPSLNTKIHDSSTEDEEIIDEQIDDLSENNPMSPEIQNLIRRKIELEKRHKLQTRTDQHVREILSQTQISQCIEVRPKYLMPDTNCFIDYLEELKALATTSNSYMLLVPTVVINEIEGLSKGMFLDVIDKQKLDVALRKEYEHNKMVGKAAKESLNFLRNKLSTVKCVTTKGSILNTFSFTAEDVSTEKASNDDRILLAAVNLSSKSLVKTKNNVQYLLREVVLLTTDRNLRVKALAQNIPVRQQTFCSQFQFAVFCKLETKKIIFHLQLQIIRAMRLDYFRMLF